MSTRSFHSLFMVASCAGAALGCYLVSLRVASERASLEQVETRIVLAQRDMRMLQTEIGTRGRLAQLERWNASVLALSAPSAGQFLNGGFELARLAQPQRKVDFQEPIVLASAPAPDTSKSVIGEPAADDSGAPQIAQANAPAQAPGLSPRALLHTASLKTETREVPARKVAATAQPTVPKSSDRPVTAAKPARIAPLDKPGLAAAKSQASAKASAPAKTQPKKVVDKPAVAAAKPVTKAPRLAKGDPLAPLPGKHVKPPKEIASAR